MPDARFAIDTNVAIAALRGEAVVQRRMSSATETFVPFIVAGELLAGAEGASRPEEERLMIEQFIGRLAYLGCDLETTRVFGRLPHHLRRAGTPIPDNDLWIAAAALRYGLTVATRDRHFERVPGLAIARWDE